MLLDLENPLRVLGRLTTPLLEPLGDKREGYVPNVVYSCGAMIHGGNLILPYAVSDLCSTIGVANLEELLSAIVAGKPTIPAASSAA